MEFESLPVVDPSSDDETQQLLIVSPDGLTPQRVTIRGAPSLFFTQFAPARPGLLLHNNGTQTVDLDNRALIRGSGDNMVEWGGNIDNGPSLVNFPGGIIAAPGLPTSDPGNGASQLWMDPVTRALFVGT